MRRFKMKFFALFPIPTIDQGYMVILQIKLLGLNSSYENSFHAPHTVVYLRPPSRPGNPEEKMDHHVVKDPVRRNL